MAIGSESFEFKTFQPKKMIYNCEVTFISLFLVLHLQANDLTLGCTRKFIPPPWYKGRGGGGGGGWNPSQEFSGMLQYFEMILPLVGSL